MTLKDKNYNEFSVKSVSRKNYTFDKSSSEWEMISRNIKYASDFDFTKEFPKQSKINFTKNTKNCKMIWHYDKTAVLT